MPRARVLLAPAALCTGVLLAAAGCSGSYLDLGERPSGSTPAGRGASPRVPSSAAPATLPALTAAQARAALVTAADLGEPWGPTRGTATWRDVLLKAGTANADCRRLLDVLYTDELLGPDPRAVSGLDDADTLAQMRYQVTARPRADVDRTLAWLRTLPQKCARFAAATQRAGVQDVRVHDRPLPAAGDARQGLWITLTGPAAEDTGEATVLTLDVAVVRVGDDAFAVTPGGTGDVPGDATEAVVRLGAQRLQDVRRQGRVLV
jgi:hypothetical protein